ncbi:ATP-binding cassette domain-containing protein [Muribaculaceae bacterium Isolate-004 (NCI)]|uniref:metal ABC transporter ATP-binding protein n=1 Tax=Paramuribaculum intestinale TaxID=2094151 RepID=UPI000FFF3B07|nr:ATP-binding cassette domain-containing protein [Paramuribaculum intestinale]RXE61265.1 ATP-binding cassette domain-containing protein [Muribaculaceae bacterium Isolate-004 (NCI)]
MDKQQRLVLISMRGVGLRHGLRRVLSGVDLDIHRGDFMAITGPNGGGKTSLLRIILRLLRPSEGEVAYFAADGSRADRLDVGYLPQKNTIDSHFPLTVSEVVASGLLGCRGMSRKDVEERTNAILRTIGMERHALQPIGRLSGGQVQRSLLGRALISEAPLLILDEPLSYVDKHFEQRIYEILREKAGNTTIVLVSHEMTAIAAMATRHIIVDGTVHVCHSDNHRVVCDCG